MLFLMVVIALYQLFNWLDRMGERSEAPDREEREITRHPSEFRLR